MSCFKDYNKLLSYAQSIDTIDIATKAEAAKKNYIQECIMTIAEQVVYDFMIENSPYDACTFTYSQHDPNNMQHPCFACGKMSPLRFDCKKYDYYDWEYTLSKSNKCKICRQITCDDCKQNSKHKQCQQMVEKVKTELLAKM